MWVYILTFEIDLTRPFAAKWSALLVKKKKNIIAITRSGVTSVFSRAELSAGMLLLFGRLKASLTSICMYACGYNSSAS